MEREGWKIVGDGKGMKVINGGGKKRGEGEKMGSLKWRIRGRERKGR